jgi:N-acetylmuramoyl-L-alanine amidase
MIERPSPNFNERAGPIDLLVLHYTGMQSAEIALKRLTDPEPKAGDYPGPWQDPAIDPATPLGRVSCHYVVDEAGQVYRLVPEEKRAWHAGASHWAGREGVNDTAIGIEIVNGGHDFGLPPFPARQTEAVVSLVAEICTRWALGPHQVVGHSDIAPARKLDPGERFPWKALADRGLALWPLKPPSEGGGLICKEGDEGPTVLMLQETLAAFGYGLPQSGVFGPETKAVVEAFQRRFRVNRIDGVLDGETMLILADVSQQSSMLRLPRRQS